MSFQSTCESWMAEEKRKVFDSVWGHLAPEKNRTYAGRIVFAVGCYADGELNPMPIACEFEDLPDSPYFYDALMEWLSDNWSGECGKVFEWTGTFRDYKLKGKTKVVYDAGGSSGGAR